MVRDARFALFSRADEGHFLGAGHIAGVAAREVTIGVGGRVHRNQRFIAHHLGNDGLIFGLRSVTPVDAIRVGVGGTDLYPLL